MLINQARIEQYSPGDDSLLQIREALAITLALRADTEFSEEELVPADIPEDFKHTETLIWHTLRGEGKIELEPLILRSADEKKVVMVIYLGSKLCGHKGIIHGGMLASLLDETLARTIIPSLPGRIGFTANFSINYRRPTFANDFVVIRAEVDKIDGRKGFVKGQIEDIKGNVLVDSEALFIAPNTARATS
ncbi:hypothetical protein K7432_010993 [Basidiobolus ranarum]|uniref:Thioesterase domain-containing protein n=1 Tax=Basidiobolus ranarum TaxID=34480 RepID=A0ABR2VVL7_9FUNG